MTPTLPTPRPSLPSIGWVVLIVGACSSPAPPPETGPPTGDDMSAVERVTTPAGRFDWVKAVLIFDAPTDRAGRRSARRSLARVLTARGYKHHMKWHRGKLVVGLGTSRAGMAERMQRLVNPAHLFSVRRVDDASDLVDRIGRLDPAALGEVQVVQSTAAVDGDEVVFAHLWSPNRSSLRRLLRRLPGPLKPPDDRELVVGPSNNGAIPGYAAFLLHRGTVATGADVSRATAWRAPSPSVNIELSSAAAGRFAEATGAWLNRRLAVVVRGKVEAVSVVREAIRGGRVSISLEGRGTVEAMRHQAEELALLLGSAADLGALNLEEVVMLGRSSGPRRATTL